MSRLFFSKLIRKFALACIGSAAVLSIGAAAAAPVIVDFETNPALPTGPSTFGGPAQTITAPGVATFSGGTILGNATNFPAQSFSTPPNVYATVANSNYSNTLTISVDSAYMVSEISFFGFNGETSPMSFTAVAYNGLSIVDTETRLLPANLNSGFAVFDLNGPNITSVTFSQTVPVGFYDFGIDTVDFNGNLMSTVPLPASAPLFGAALLGLAGLSFASKRKKAIGTV